MPWHIQPSGPLGATPQRANNFAGSPQWDHGRKAAPAKYVAYARTAPNAHESTCQGGTGVKAVRRCSTKAVTLRGTRWRRG